MVSGSSVITGGGRPTRGYRLADGTKVPSVTTITSRFKDAGGLIHWAWQQGIDGINYRESRDKAAEAGSICHGWIESWIHRGDWDAVPVAEELTEVEQQALVGYKAFLDWAESVHLEVLETEVALVSEKYKFGGTFDALALVAGKPKLLDWKTSNAVYGEYVAQVAAYRQLIRERAVEVYGITNPEDLAPDSALLLRIGKEHADFHLHSYPSSVLDLGWRYFLLAREMYDLDKQLKKVAA